MIRPVDGHILRVKGEREGLGKSSMRFKAILSQAIFLSGWRGMRIIRLLKHFMAVRCSLMTI